MLLLIISRTTILMAGLIIGIFCMIGLRFSDYFARIAALGVVVALVIGISLNSSFNMSDVLSKKAEHILIYQLEQNGVKNGVLENAVFQVSDDGKKVQFAAGNLELRLRDTMFVIMSKQYDMVGINEEHKDVFNLHEAEAIHTSRSHWRLLYDWEWGYIVDHNPTFWVTVCGVKGLLIIPEQSSIMLHSLDINQDEWNAFQTQGAVFLPAAGKYDFSTNQVIDSPGTIGYYKVHYDQVYNRGKSNRDIKFSKDIRPQLTAASGGQVSIRLVRSVQ